ncbi:MAG: exosortase A [Rubrivivax sp.]|nr:exosortase A [Rubrivivax sp.]
MSAVPSLEGVAGAAVRESAWRRALPLWLAALAWIGFWYRDTALAMWGEWTFSDTYAHGMLVAPISIWLAWRRRHELATLVPQPSPWVLVPMAGAALVWFVADLVAVHSATQFAFVTLIVLSVPAVLGVEVARAVMFPLGFLFFAVPFGDFMIEPLMLWTADFVVAALRFSGVPVLREGLQFVIPSGKWSVVAECSGVRYLIASVMVGSLFAYLNYRSTKRRLIFVGIAILVPIVANWLRAYIIVMLGHLTDNKIAAGADHLIYGWVFFGFVITIMFLIGMRWAEPEGPPAGASALGGVPDNGAASATAGALWAGVVGTVLVAFAPHGAQSALAAIERHDEPNLAAVANPAGGWQAVAPESVAALPQWKPIFGNPSAERMQAFVRDGQAVGLYVAYYRQQSYDRKLVSGSNMLVSPRDKTWARTASGRRSVQAAGQRFDVRTADLRGGPLIGDAHRLHVWQVYWVNGRWVEGDVPAKLHGALARMLGRGDESAAMVLYTPRAAGGDPAEVLRDFLAANLGPIEQALVATRDGPPLEPVAARPAENSR